jgi:hypothetical protein
MTKEEYEIYTKVQHEFYIEDARIFCNANKLEYNDELLNDMAKYVSDRFDCTITYWDNFMQAYPLNK